MDNEKLKKMNQMNEEYQKKMNQFIANRNLTNQNYNSHMPLNHTYYAPLNNYGYNTNIPYNNY